MRLFLFSLVASIFFVGAVAFSAEGKFDSLKGRTQLAGAGYVAYSQSDTVDWYLQTSGYHYVLPNLGVGGVANLYKVSGLDLLYTVGPAAEYFVPVTDRGHITFDGALTYVGGRGRDPSFGLQAAAGYRYFVTDDIAIGAKLTQSWRKYTDSDKGFKRDSDLTLLVGFSLFF